MSILKKSIFSPWHWILHLLRSKSSSSRNSTWWILLTSWMFGSRSVSCKSLAELMDGWQPQVTWRTLRGIWCVKKNGLQRKLPNILSKESGCGACDMCLNLNYNTLDIYYYLGNKNSQCRAVIECDYQKHLTATSFFFWSRTRCLLTQVHRIALLISTNFHTISLWKIQINFSEERKERNQQTSFVTSKTPSWIFL